MNWYTYKLLQHRKGLSKSFLYLFAQTSGMGEQDWQYTSSLQTFMDPCSQTSWGSLQLHLCIKLALAGNTAKTLSPQPQQVAGESMEERDRGQIWETLLGGGAVCDGKLGPERYGEGNWRKPPGSSLERWTSNYWGHQYAGLERDNVCIGCSLCPAPQAACRFTAEHYRRGTAFSGAASKREWPGTLTPARRFWCRPWVFLNWQEWSGVSPLAKSILHARRPKI